MATPTAYHLIQTLSISTALLTSGGIATLSLFDIPILKSQPASRSLPSIRWLFSRGSHIFPTAAFLSGAGFTYLAYASLPPKSDSVAQILRIATSGGKVSGYLAAAVLTFGIAPLTAIMIPTNFELIAKNEKKGGARSSKVEDAREKSGDQGGKARSAEESVNGEGDVNQFSDLSGPQGKTDEEASSKEEEERVQELLTKFAWLNGGRAVLVGVGGVVGLVVALGV
ncbi:hypothetical protein EJ08DRAFT_63800 [Tothia fuscella]|uniref:DUF1772-domain-containing protein n=1 Tax=Tothia fuscella TaxID=1048955 RepID=A0A9P4NF86_9PEZI|nr:hypothetical protein EJ08DRAFT_63800 [Tothia fuscella]